MHHRFNMLRMIGVNDAELNPGFYHLPLSACWRLHNVFLVNHTRYQCKPGILLQPLLCLFRDVECLTQTARPDDMLAKSLSRPTRVDILHHPLFIRITHARVLLPFLQRQL